MERYGAVIGGRGSGAAAVRGDGMAENRRLCRDGGKGDGRGMCILPKIQTVLTLGHSLQLQSRRYVLLCSGSTPTLAPSPPCTYSF
jgi:hypothetical protein